MQIGCDKVTGVALGNSIEIEDRTDSGNGGGEVRKKLVHPADGPEAVDSSCGRKRSVSETEAPGIVQRAGCDIKGASGQVPVVPATVEHIQEKAVGANFRTGIVAAQDRGLVVAGEACVDQGEYRIYGVGDGLLVRSDSFAVVGHGIFTALGITADTGIFGSMRTG